MEKLIFLLVCTALFTFNEKTDAQTTKGAKKMLVVYFSHSGNTRTLAKMIQKATSADIFEIQLLKPYPTEYQAVVDQAKKEINADVRPELKNQIENIEQYDVIFIGSPCWWSTIAPPVSTFLTSYDFSGKTLVPFMTHGGSRMGHSVGDIRKLCPKATVLEGLPVSGSSVQNATSEVTQWLKKIGIID